MPQLATRDRRIWSAVVKGLVGSVLIGLVAVLSGVLARRTGSDFWHGFSGGVLIALPLALAVLFWLAYRSMDEYGQRLHQRAGSAAFFVTMLLTAFGFALSSVLPFQVPLWVVYTAGMLSWAVATAVIAARDGRRT